MWRNQWSFDGAAHHDFRLQNCIRLPCHCRHSLLSIRKTGQEGQITRTDHRQIGLLKRWTNIFKHFSGSQYALRGRCWPHNNHGFARFPNSRIFRHSSGQSVRRAGHSEIHQGVHSQLERIGHCFARCWRSQTVYFIKYKMQSTKESLQLPIVSMWTLLWSTRRGSLQTKWRRWHWWAT